MTLPRFHHPDLAAAADGTIALPGDEAHHLTRVLRLTAGARVLVFDGRGRQELAEIVEVGRDRARLRLLEPHPAAPELPVRLTLAQALVKSDAMDHIVRDATMMGAAAIVPVIARRSVVPARAASQASVLERWRRIAIAAAKQCGRAVVPDIAGPVPLERLVREARAGLRLMLVEPSLHGRAESARKAVAAGPVPADAIVLSGPEGGWTDDELAAASAAGWSALGIGPMTLRAEVAPLAALAVLSWTWSGDAG